MIALANFFYGPALYRLSQQQAGAFSLLRQFGPPGLQILQGVLAVVLITLSFQGFLPGERLDCSLENNWKRLWMTHDGRAIERIQDAFNCCGFKTIKDRAWPPQIGQCSQLYGRQSACVGSWRASMQRNSGLEFAVAVTVGILQVGSDRPTLMLSPANLPGSARPTCHVSIGPIRKGQRQKIQTDHAERECRPSRGAVAR